MLHWLSGSMEVYVALPRFRGLYAHNYFSPEAQA